MVVGVLHIELLIPGSNSLKTKRSIIKGIKDRLRSRFNVSVAEIDYTDKWQRASLGVSSVSNRKKHVESILGKVLALIYDDHRVEVIHSTITFV